MSGKASVLRELVSDSASFSVGVVKRNGDCEGAKAALDGAIGRLETAPPGSSIVLEFGRGVERATSLSC